MGFPTEKIKHKKCLTIEKKQQQTQQKRYKKKILCV